MDADVDKRTLCSVLRSSAAVQLCPKPLCFCTSALHKLTPTGTIGWKPTEQKSCRSKVASPRRCLDWKKFQLGWTSLTSVKFLEQAVKNEQTMDIVGLNSWSKPDPVAKPPWPPQDIVLDSQIIVVPHTMISFGLKTTQWDGSFFSIRAVLYSSVMDS